MKKTIATFIILLSALISFNSVSSNKAQAATIKLSNSYKANVKYWKHPQWNNKRLVALKKASKHDMIENIYHDENTHDQQTTIDTSKLNHQEQKELSLFTLKTINSARKQMHKKQWRYSNRALHFANDIAKEYYQHNHSVWDSDHYYAGIARAAKKHGLNSHLGNVYEDESGLPINSNNLTSKRTIAQAKEQLYFNIKQMLFGGFYGNNYNNLSSYYEWNHAADLLSTYPYSNSSREFATSFSILKNKPDHVSVHMIGVDKRYIQNYRKFK